MLLRKDSHSERNGSNAHPLVNNNDTRPPPISSATTEHRPSALPGPAPDAIVLATEQGSLLALKAQTEKRFVSEHEERHGQFLEAKRSTKILVVEDNPVDVRMLRHILKQEKTWATEIEVLEDGEAAINYLTRQNSFTDAVKPDLIILDLNLPKRDGTEVLQVIRSTENLKHLPVFVFSSSPEDVMQQRVQNASVVADRYLTKPVAAKDVLALGEILHRAFEEVTNVRNTR